MYGSKKAAVIPVPNDDDYEDEEDVEYDGEEGDFAYV